MKILELKLLAFGPFTELCLDLSEGEEGLHLIYGPNEAGKSSSLRALRQMFYGIPNVCTDNFKHAYNSLRLGAKLSKRDGVTLEFIRRKANKHMLRGADDDAILDESELRRFLGGVDQNTFETMFGIDHATLVKGGKAIVEGGGDIGQILFAAGTGIADLRSVQEDLKKEAEEMFLPRGSTKTINKALIELEKSRKALREAELPSAEWHKHDQALRDARAAKKEVEEQLAHKERAKNRLLRIQDALPAIVQLHETLKNLREYKSAILLPPDFGDKRRDALNQLRHAQESEQEAQQALAALDLALGDLPVPQDLLDQGKQIEELHRQLGSHQKAMKDRIGLVRQREQVLNDAEATLRSLGRAPDLSQIEPLRLSNAERVRIQNLGNQSQALIEKVQGAQALLASQAEQIASANQELSALPAPRDPSELRAVLRRAVEQGKLEEQWQAARQVLQQTEHQANLDLRKLPLWAGTMEALEQLPVPGEETLEHYQTEFAGVDQALKALQEQSVQLEKELTDHARAIERLQHEQEVPTEEDVNATRQQRDQGWQLVRRAWQEHGEETTERAFIAAFAPAHDLAAAYELSVQKADTVVDRLRHDAQRVALKVKLLADQKTCQERLAKLHEKLGTTLEQRCQLQQHWTTLWQPLGIVPLTPKEMNAWLRKQRELVKKAEALRDKRTVVETLVQRIADQRHELNECLQRMGVRRATEPSETPTPETETLAALIERSRLYIERIEKVSNRREELQRDLAKQQKEQTLTAKQAQQAEEALKRWQVQWADAMKQLGLRAEAAPSEANKVLEDVADLFTKMREAETLHGRIQGIDNDAKHFAKDAALVAERVQQDLATTVVEELVTELHGRLSRSRAAQARHATLLKQRQAEEDKRQVARRTGIEATRLLEAMCREADCPDSAGLKTAEERSTQRRKLDEELAGLETQLRHLSAPTSVADFMAEATKVDRDALPSKIRQLEEEIQALDQAKVHHAETVGQETNELGRMDGSALAAEAAEQTQQLLAQLGSDVEHYVRLRVASAVLRDGIDRYREKHQGPVIKRASELFAQLTVGSFQGLKDDYDDKGKGVLMGVRAETKELVPVSGMSEGTGDQLYLALRLASLETYLDKNEPLPFIVDDILINFDDARASAALRVLAQFAKRTQILFFTHHEHLVKLAHTHLDDAVLFTHDLNQRSASKPRQKTFA